MKEIAIINGKKLKKHEKENREDLKVYEGYDGKVWVSYVNDGDLFRGTFEELGEWMNNNLTK